MEEEGWPVFVKTERTWAGADLLDSGRPVLAANPQETHSAQQVEGGLAFKATVPKLGGHAEVTAAAASLEKAGN